MKNGFGKTPRRSNSLATPTFFPYSPTFHIDKLTTAFHSVDELSAKMKRSYQLW